eukprot:TRINITY_DN815_c0_g1_i1.p1 TRINITY_DN815_c0_g1~~TRINITY_DN815_c0_g1_i1.p1  ORF type:complete len:343 (-),score=139.36 TRINITY_DN815_c0_g1_i1:126-1154(-)
MSGLAQYLKEDPTKNKEKKIKEKKIKTEESLVKKEIKEENAEELEEGEMSEGETGLGVFEDPTLVDYSQFDPKPTKKELKEIARKQKEIENRTKIDLLKQQWNPKEDPNTTSDAYKTLFVSRLSYETTETTLRNEFEIYGTIKKIRLVYDNEGKPRGYAFIEFEHQRDMKEAYKHADAKKIDGRRIVVDYERGRTIKNWIPRRFGGGKGSSRITSSSSSHSSSHSSGSSVLSYSSSSSRYSSSSSSRYSSSSSRRKSRSRSKDRYEERDRRDRDRYDEKERDRDGRDKDRDRYDEKERDRYDDRDRHGDRDRYDDKKRKSPSSSSSKESKRRRSRSNDKRYK